MSNTLTKEQIEKWRDTGDWPGPDFPEQVLDLFIEREKLINARKWLYETFAKVTAPEWKG